MPFMFLIIFSIFSIFVVAAKVIYRQMSTKYFDTMNKDLDVYYTMDSSNRQNRLRQLTKAAAFTIIRLTELKDKIEEVSQLVEERLISNTYLNDLLDLQREFILERVIIKNEAESLIPGISEQLLEEAKKIKSGRSENKKLNYIDSKLFLKKKEMFLNSFQNKVNSN